MLAFRRAIFSYNQGTCGGTAPTCSAAATLQTSPDGSTWTNEANDVGAITITAQNTGVTKEIRASQVTAGKRYARLQVVSTIGGTSPTIPAQASPSASKPTTSPAAPRTTSRRTRRRIRM
jgi:hypothetical protein